MTDPSVEHLERVNAWLGRRGRLPAERLRDALQRAFDALCARARVPLGEITTVAIVERLLLAASDRFPVFRPPHANGSARARWDLRAASRTLSASDLEEVARFVLVELLSMLGNLTADVLTPALHAELSKVPVAKGGGARSTTRRTPRGRSSDIGNRPTRSSRG